MTSAESFNDVFAAPRETTDAERERTNRLLAEARPIVSALDAVSAAWNAAWDGGERRLAVLDPLEAAYNHAFHAYVTWMRTTCNTLKKTESPTNARAIVDYLVSRARILNQPAQPTDNHGNPIDTPTCYYCDTPIAADRKYCNDCGQREPGLPCATCGHIISIREPYYVDNGVHHIGCYPR